MTHYIPKLRLVALCAALATAPAALASVIQSTPDLPPTGAGAAYVLQDLCIPNILGTKGVCVVGAHLSGFTGITSTITAGGQQIDATADFQAKLYLYEFGVKGPLLGPFLLTGPIGFLYGNRTSEQELGTFPTFLTELTLNGIFNGMPIAAKGNTTKTTGSTTVSQVGNDFLVDSFFDFYGELSINGGPFIPGPLRHLGLQTIPEPATAALSALGFAMVGVALRRARRLGA